MGQVSKTKKTKLADASLPDDITTIGDVLDAYYVGNTFGDTARGHRQKTRLERCKIDLVAALGQVKVYNLAYTEINRKDANAYRDHLLEQVVP